MRRKAIIQRMIQRDVNEVREMDYFFMVVVPDKPDTDHRSSLQGEYSLD